MAEDEFSTSQLIIQRLIDRMLPRIDHSYQIWLTDYLKDATLVRGVRMQQLRDVVQLWNQEWELHRPTIPVDIKLSVITLLLSSEYFEDKLAAIIYMSDVLIPTREICLQHLSLFEQLFSQGHLDCFKVCDHFASKVLQPLIINHGSDIANHLATWFDANSVWQARTALGGLSYFAADALYDDLLLTGCDKLSRRPEQEAKNSTASSLRALGRTRPEIVQNYLQDDDHLVNLDAAALAKAIGNFPTELKDQLKARRRALVVQRRAAEAAVGIQYEPINPISSSIGREIISTHVPISESTMQVMTNRPMEQTLTSSSQLPMEYQVEPTESGHEEQQQQPYMSEQQVMGSINRENQAITSMQPIESYEMIEHERVEERQEMETEMVSHETVEAVRSTTWTGEGQQQDEREQGEEE